MVSGFGVSLVYIVRHCLKKVKYLRLGLAVHTLISTLQRQRKVDLYEIEASIYNIEDSRLARTTY